MFVLSCHPVAFSFLGWSVYWYGIIYATALLCSWGIATWVLRKLRNNKIHVPSVEDFDKFMAFAIISIVVGARLGHVLFFQFDYFINRPLEIFMIHRGGLSFHGAVIGLGLYSYFFVKKHNITWKLLADVLCLAGALGVGIGRIANFINQELYGRITGSDCAVIFRYVDQMPRYPTQLFESFFEGFLNFWIMFIVFRLKGVKVMGTGALVALFCIIYSSSRFIIEFYKEVETYTYFNRISLTIGQMLSLVLLIFGIFVLYYKKRELKNSF